MSDYDELRIWAQMFDDHQKHRIATMNRVGRRADGEDSDAPHNVDPVLYEAVLDELTHAEKTIGKAMRGCYRRVVDPDIIKWQQVTTGIGEHLLARLLGVTGHPVHTTRHHWEGDGAERVLVCDGPYERRVSDLWSYCGHGDANRKRSKGMDKDEAMALGSDRAKMLVHLLAESCMKNRTSPFRRVYDERRARTAEREDWTDMHRHNDALRIVGKAILLDLWLAARYGTMGGEVEVAA